MLVGNFTNDAWRASHSGVSQQKERPKARQLLAKSASRKGIMMQHLPFSREVWRRFLAVVVCPFLIAIILLELGAKTNFKVSVDDNGISAWKPPFPSLLGRPLNLSFVSNDSLPYVQNILMKWTAPIKQPDSTIPLFTRNEGFNLAYELLTAPIQPTKPLSIVEGPTGCGKSTAFLSTANSLQNSWFRHPNVAVNYMRFNLVDLLGWNDVITSGIGVYNSFGSFSSYGPLQTERNVTWEESVRYLQDAAMALHRAGQKPVFVLDDVDMLFR